VIITSIAVEAQAGVTAVTAIIRESLLLKASATLFSLPFKHLL
jgi:hypothetical protein